MAKQKTLKEEYLSEITVRLDDLANKQQEKPDLFPVTNAHAQMLLAREKENGSMAMNPPPAFAPVEEQVEGYADFSYGKLGTVLAATYGLILVAQTSHWAAKGNNFYQNHLLFQKVYEVMNELVDSIGERAVGLSRNGEIVEPCRLMKNACLLAAESKTAHEDLNLKVYLAICSYKKIVMKAYKEMRADGIMTPGLENLLQDVLDKVEQLEYLLGRVQAGMLG